MVREKDEVFSTGDSDSYDNESEHANVLRIVSEKEADRATRERPHPFGLPGEGLKATRLLTHKLVTTTDTAVPLKRHRHPPAIKEAMQRQITQYLEVGIIKLSDKPILIDDVGSPEKS